jgi:hypothetical protein
MWQLEQTSSWQGVVRGTTPVKALPSRLLIAVFSERKLLNYLNYQLRQVTNQQLRHCYRETWI